MNAEVGMKLKTNMIMKLKLCLCYVSVTARHSVAYVGQRPPLTEFSLPVCPIRVSNLGTKGRRNFIFNVQIPCGNKCNCKCYF